MLIIEQNAVYELDCECLQKKRGRSGDCKEDSSKENIIVQKGDICKEQLSYTGKGVTVAVLDTGLYPHPDFRERIVGWYDAVGKEARPVDPNGHGTQEEGKFCAIPEGSGCRKFMGCDPGSVVDVGSLWVRSRKCSGRWEFIGFNPVVYEASRSNRKPQAFGRRFAAPRPN